MAGHKATLLAVLVGLLCVFSGEGRRLEQITIVEEVNNGQQRTRIDSDGTRLSSSARSVGRGPGTVVARAASSTVPGTPRAEALAIGQDSDGLPTGVGARLSPNPGPQPPQTGPGATVRTRGRGSASGPGATVVVRGSGSASSGATVETRGSGSATGTDTKVTTTTRTSTSAPEEVTEEPSEVTEEVTEEPEEPAVTEEVTEEPEVTEEVTEEPTEEEPTEEEPVKEMPVEEAPEEPVKALPLEKAPEEPVEEPTEEEPVEEAPEEVEPVVVKTPLPLTEEESEESEEPAVLPPKMPEPPKQKETEEVFVDSEVVEVAGKSGSEVCLTRDTSKLEELLDGGYRVTILSPTRFGYEITRMMRHGFATSQTTIVVGKVPESVQKLCNYNPEIEPVQAKHLVSQPSSSALENLCKSSLVLDFSSLLHLCWDAGYLTIVDIALRH